MNVRLAFGRQGLDVTLPDGYEYELLESPVISAAADTNAAIEAALNQPVSGRPLEDLARGKRSAAIAVCDITRPAPNSLVLPPILARLDAAGLPRTGIRILIATGLHRPATPAEIGEIVGPQVAREYEVLNHDGRDARLHGLVGTTQSGTQAWIDARFLDADLHITLGLIEPHIMLGFSGGRKLIAPGLASEATIKVLHGSPFMRDPRTSEGSFDDNPLHHELLEIARLAPHDFLIDVALTRDRRVAGVWAGHPEAAHRAGVDWVRRAMYRKVSRAADAVITTGAGYPLDLTFYQSIKGVTAASHVVRNGGRVLLFGACEEGAGAAEFTRMLEGHASHGEFLRSIEAAPTTVDQWQLEKLALAAENAHLLFCTPGLSELQQSKLWGEATGNPEKALAAFFKGLPPGSAVAVMPEGPYVFAGL